MFNHNLMDLMPAEAEAGPSRLRGRASLPARTTRRQAQEQSDLINGAVAPSRHAAVEDAKGKGKPSVEASSQPPVRKLKLHFNAATTLDPTASSEITDGDLPLLQATEFPGLKQSKKRARQSLPNLPMRALRPRITEADPLPAAPNDHVDTPPDASEEADPLDPASSTVTKPSLSHHPFPPPPPRRKFRRPGPKDIWYTMPDQLPLLPVYPNLAAYLATYVHIDDTGPQPDARALEIRALNEAYFANRLAYLQSQGRMLHIDSVDHITTKAKAGPSRLTDHHDSLMSHMVQVRNAMMVEAKAKPVVSKRIARMVMQHWEMEEGKEERERQAEEREQRRKVRDLARALKKKWSLAVKVRFRAIQDLS